jgi:molybdate transport system ATP-binding protein
MLEIDVEHRRGAFQLQARFSAGAGITALFGRSGSGKTTLVQAIAGLLRPERGVIQVNHNTLFESEQGINRPPHDRQVGYVFQEGRLFPHLTVKQNLTYGRLFVSAREHYVQFDHVVALLDLAPLLTRYPAALSGGEKQRVAIGRALLASPRLLLMDEPLASLDIQHKGEILQYIEQLHDEFNLPIVYVSHAVEEVVRLADTIVVLSEGKVVAVGEVGDILSRLNLRPAVGRFEAGAVIETRVVAYDETYGLSTLRFGGGELAVTSVDALVGETVRVRIRARDVAIALDRPARISVQNVLRGRVSEISSENGPLVDVLIRVGEANLVARITRRSADELNLQEGQDVYAMVKAVSLDRHSVGFA